MKADEEARGEYSRIALVQRAQFHHTEHEVDVPTCYLGILRMVFTDVS